MFPSLPYYTWSGVINALRSVPPGSTVRIPATQIAHPLDAYMTPTIALQVGQRADFRIALDQWTICHVRDFGGYYDVQLYAVMPPLLPQPPVMPSNPGAAILSSTALGGLLGAALGGTKDGAIAGALIGGIAGLAAVGVNSASTSPETTRAAKELLEVLMKSLSPQSATPPALAAADEKPALPSTMEELQNRRR